jgi:hypothetical protein
MRRLRRLAAIAIPLGVIVGFAWASTAQARTPTLNEYKLGAGKLTKLRDHWVSQLTSRYGEHTWAPMRFTVHNRDLRLMGLPPKRVLLSHRYRVPKAVYPSGKVVKLASRKRDSGGRGGGSASTASSPAVAAYAGAGFFGIRPGAWLLLINGNSIGWCSMAHVYGTPGNYQISTAGHCGKPGDIATVVGAVGDHKVGGQPVPVLLDFGTFKTSQDGGLGKDWALISIYQQDQSLVTPTMAFWGGPIGMYTSQGDVLNVNLTGRQPQISANPNPVLVQQVVHYGHGTGVGAGGTPRSGTAITWRPSYFMFFGGISPGDSGSGANTLTGDAVGDNREAAGIMTHLWIDSQLRQGVGIMAGTRATQVQATLANGQILPYPASAPMLP